MSFSSNNRFSLTNDITPLVCLINLWLPRFMLISPLYKIYIFTLNHKITYVLVATDKLSSQLITSQLLGGGYVLILLVYSGV